MTTPSDTTLNPAATNSMTGIEVKVIPRVVMTETVDNGSPTHGRTHRGGASGMTAARQRPETARSRTTPRPPARELGARDPEPLVPDPTFQTFWSISIAPSQQADWSFCPFLMALERRRGLSNSWLAHPGWHLRGRLMRTASQSARSEHRSCATEEMR